MLSQVGDVYASWHGHVIVCGLEGVGLRIVEQLTALIISINIRNKARAGVKITGLHG